MPSATPGSAPSLLDVRPAAAYHAAHAPGAAGIPLEEITRRVHELPPANDAIAVLDADPHRAQQAMAILRQRGHPAVLAAWDPSALTESGPPRVHLWRPNAFLIEALELIDATPASASLPGDARRALDIACGAGRDAAYLARAGYRVDAIDLLPDALERATDLAFHAGVHIQPVCLNLERDPPPSLGQYELVVAFRYLHRPLFSAMRNAVLPGGYIVYETFHERNRQTGRRPLNPAHLLTTGELAGAFAGFDILIDRDAVDREGRFFSSFLARRPAP